MTPEEVVKDGQELMQKCFAAVEKIIGRRPMGEEIAMVDSLFIWASKELYFRGRR